MENYPVTSNDIENFSSPIAEELHAILSELRDNLAKASINLTTPIFKIIDQIEALFENYWITSPNNLETFIKLTFAIDELEFKLRDFKTLRLKEAGENLDTHKRIDILANLPDPLVFDTILRRLVREQPLIETLCALNFNLDIENKNFFSSNESLFGNSFAYLEPNTSGNLKDTLIKNPPTKNPPKLSTFTYALYTLHYMQLCEKLKQYYPEKTEDEIQALISNIVTIISMLGRFDRFDLHSDFFPIFSDTYWQQQPEASLIQASDKQAQTLFPQIIPRIKKNLNDLKLLRDSIEERIESIIQVGETLPIKLLVATNTLAQRLQELSDIYFSDISRTPFLDNSNLDKYEHEKSAARNFLKAATLDIHQYLLKYGDTKEFVQKEKNLNCLMRLLRSLLACIKWLFCIPPTSQPQFFTLPIEKVEVETNALLTIINKECLPKLQSSNEKSISATM